MDSTVKSYMAIVNQGDKFRLLIHGHTTSILTSATKMIVLRDGTYYETHIGLNVPLFNNTDTITSRWYPNGWALQPIKEHEETNNTDGLHRDDVGIL